MFLIKPKYQKCATQVEYWTKNGVVIERVQLWRWAEVKVDGKNMKEVQKILKNKDAFDRVCINDLFEEREDELKDCVSDDLCFPDDFPEKESKRLSKLFSKDPEGMFESEGWEIDETKLFLESDLEVSEEK